MFIQVPSAILGVTTLWGESVKSLDFLCVHTNEVWQGNLPADIDGVAHVKAPRIHEPTKYLVNEDLAPPPSLSPF
jgi:hypothetical protein